MSLEMQVKVEPKGSLGTPLAVLKIKVSPGAIFARGVEYDWITYGFIIIEDIREVNETVKLFHFLWDRDLYTNLSPDNIETITTQLKSFGYRPDSSKVTQYFVDLVGKSF
jgi:hypothetical protein